MQTIRSRYAGVIIITLLFIGVTLGLIMPMGKGPTWHDITVGESTADDLANKMGPPSRIERRLGVSVYYYRLGQFDWAAHKVFIRGNRVTRIEENMSVYFPEEILLTSYIERYGTPKYVMWSMNTAGDRVAVFPSHGVLVSATALPLEEAIVTQAIYFRPCSIFCIQLRFVSVFSPINPFPNSDVVGSKDPWGLSQPNWP